MFNIAVKCVRKKFINLEILREGRCGSQKPKVFKESIKLVGRHSGTANLICFSLAYDVQ